MNKNKNSEEPKAERAAERDPGLASMQSYFRFERFFYDETITLVRDGRPVLSVMKVRDGTLSVECNSGALVSPNDFDNQELLSRFWETALAMRPHD